MRAYIGRYSGDAEKSKQAHDLLFSAPPSIVGCDIETISIKNKSILGIGFATLNNDNFYYTIDDPSLPWHLLHLPTITNVYHNATFDLSLEALGKFGANIDNIEDTAMLMRLLLLEVQLEAASLLYLPEEYHTQSVLELFRQYNITSKSKSMLDLPPLVVMEKGARDAQACLRLFEKFYPKVDKRYYRNKIKSTSLMLHMAHRGIKLDKPFVQAVHDDIAPEAAKWRATCIKLGFKPMAHMAIIEAFAANGYVVPFKWGKPSTAEEDLLKIILPDGELHPWVNYILRARKYNKMNSTYVEPLVGKDRAFTHFHLDAATGRSTSSDLNIQNVPTGERPGDIVSKAVKCPLHNQDYLFYKCAACNNIRGMFLPDKDKLTSIDKKQIELRCFAWISGDQKLQAVLADSTQDLHNSTLEVLRRKFPKTNRVQCKNVNFGVIFSGFNSKSAATIASGANLPGRTGVALVIEIIKFWIKEFPVAVNWAKLQTISVSKTLRVITLKGRTLDLNKTNLPITDKHIENCAINWPVQASAFEVFEEFMLTIIDQKIIPIEDFMWQVHDEVNLDGAYENTLEPYRKDLEHLQPFWTPYEIEEIPRWK